MPNPVTKWQYAKAIEKEIQSSLQDKENQPLYDDIDKFLVEFRRVCQEVIFMDFQYAVEQGVEALLWNTHVVLKNRYKKLVDYYKEKAQERKVERRKLERRYVDFIKDTRHFYTGYIQRLNSTFGGIEGLARIAQCMSLEDLSVDDPLEASPHLQDLVEQSCHATLLRLGDLCRYRNDVRNNPANRSWEPALGYYQLAADLCPDSGSSHNQMAVIALADQDHLGALYHLYRAIAVKDPHPLAANNLEIEFKKITQLWEKSTASSAKADKESTLILWFVRLHAKLYKGIVFATHDELETEVLSRLKLLLKEESSEITLEKFVIINIAAEYFAAERVLEGKESATSNPTQSFYFFLRFNVRLLTALLQVLDLELRDLVNGREQSAVIDRADSTNPTTSREMFTAITRRILPAVRQFSTWLVSRINLIVNTTQDCGINLQMYIKQFFSMYADVMTRITHAFPVTSLPSVKYLLQEDETTIGFKPLQDPNIAVESNLYLDANDNLKPRLTDKIKRSSPDVEMQSRVHDIILCAVTIQSKDNAPVKFVTQSQAFVVVGQSQSLLPSADQFQRPSSHHSNEPVLTKSPTSSRGYNGQGNSGMRTDRYTSPSHGSTDTDMHHMVDSLIATSIGGRSDVNDTSYGMHSRTANEIFAPIGSNGLYAQQCSPQMLPSLSGIWQTAFTPKPNELHPTSPERYAPTRSPFQYTSPERRSNTTKAIASSDYSDINNDPWKTLGSNSALPPIARKSKEIEGLQYMPQQSSAFTDTSSIYGNITPIRYANNPFGPRTDTLAARNGDGGGSAAGSGDYDRFAMLNSSVWNETQLAHGGYSQTPPGGQGG